MEMMTTSGFMPTDPAAIAAAESAKARIQTAYMMAMHRPRRPDQARIRILNACRNPKFADQVEFAKPVGGQKITGASIRFAELALREWGNVQTESTTVYEDDRVRRIAVHCLDLETNASFSKHIQINKTVERKNTAGREIIGDRTNTNGQKVFIVKATEDELMNKEAALVSKAIRNEGLRLLPQDLVQEAIDTARATIKNQYAADPESGKKKLLDAFAAIGIMPREIEKYIGHALDHLAPAEMDDLRGVYRGLKDGETTWAAIMPTEEKTETVTEKLKAAPAATEIYAPKNAPKPVKTAQNGAKTAQKASKPAETEKPDLAPPPHVTADQIDQVKALCKAKELNAAETNGFMQYALGNAPTAEMAAKVIAEFDDFLDGFIEAKQDG